MDRGDLQGLAEARLRESEVLLGASEPAGAYYLAGYAVECGFKACIAKQVRQHEFPDRKLAQAVHTHSLSELRNLAGLGGQVVAMPAAVVPNWLVAKDWSEASRYELRSISEAQALVEAVGDAYDGVLAWLRLHW